MNIADLRRSSDSDLQQHIALLDRDEKTVTMTAASGFKDGFATMHKRLENGELPDCMKKALALDKAIVVENPKTHCLNCPLAGEYDDRSEPGRYLVYEGRIYGYLAMSVPANFARDSEEQGLFAELADDLSFTLSKIATAEALYRTRYSIDNMADTAGIIQYINPSFERTTGYSRDEVLGRTPPNPQQRPTRPSLLPGTLVNHRTRCDL